ncbi:hypothetical protein JXA02_05270 [candidate division KSB1 bacterium]|nr:hypothetical protein [candidate division KSB1 bacterium]RQW08111.1 MAG: hypothetical protein EH222_06055 [candidate division KSB1 bacterium]
MNRFSSLLNSINDRLEIAQPIKSRILLEIAADLQDAHDFYLGQGHTEEEATRLTQERFLLDDAAIAELAAVHQPLVKKILDRFSLQVQSRWQRIILLLTLLTIAAVSGRVMMTSEFLADASPFVWPVWGTAIAGLLLFLYKFYQLYLIKNHTIRTLRKGVHSLALLGLLSLLFGLSGYFYELLVFGMQLVLPGGSLITVVCTVTDSAEKIIDIHNCYVRTSTVMMASLFVAMLIGLLWYALMNKIAQIEMAEAKSILLT